jgi:GNAT superfamily N-acetyltransferase
MIGSFQSLLSAEGGAFRNKSPMNTTKNPQLLTFRDLEYRPDDLAILKRFYREVYVPEFPSRDERESLENMETYLRLKANGWYGRNNYHIVLGFDGEAAVAGAFADYLDEPNSGVIEFLVVRPALRGGGLGRQLLDETERHLAVDAHALGRAGLDLIAAEMNDPYKKNADSMDAFHRAATWDQWGYGLLDFPYVQPPLSADKARVDGLVLIAKACRSEFARALPTVKVKAILRGYMRWAMRIDTPEDTADYRLMARHLDADLITISGLRAYTGYDAARQFVVHEVVEVADPALVAALAVYARAFPGGRTDLNPDYFRAAVSERGANKDERYHFWAISRGPDSPVEGMASFFTFPQAGFGGYVVLDGSLRHTRRFPLLIARIEECMIRDALGAEGWYIECDPKQETLFLRHGFYTVDMAYAQPSLPGDAPYAPAQAPPLCLMYKPFGRSFAAPQVSVRSFRDCLASVFRSVYGVKNILQSPFYRYLCAAVESWPASRVPFRAVGAQSG